MVGAKTALIVGGGIGGLTAAIAFQRLGFEVTVFERAREFREIGAGLWLWQNALGALDRIAMGDTIRAAGVRDAHGGVRTWQGRVLVERIPSQISQTSVAILRADLQTALYNALASGIVQHGAACTGFEQEPDGVTVHLSDGRTAHGDILVGADGLHSVIRSQLFGAANPRYAGFTAWRAITTFPHEQIPAGVSWGRGARFGFMPIPHGRVNWFAGQATPERGQDRAGGRKREVLERFRNWHAPISEVIEATDEADILRNDIYYRPALKAWSQGRVTLLGDAAHPMTPSIGQGACQAIEDAIVLASCFREQSDPVIALQEYERQRIPRASAVTRHSYRMDWIALQRNPLVCWLRNTVVAHFPGAWRDRQLTWILSYNVN